jgi:hypothetical protein
LHNANQRLKCESNRLLPRALQQLSYSGERLNIPAENGKVRSQRHERDEPIFARLSHQERKVQIEQENAENGNPHSALRPRAALSDILLKVLDIAVKNAAFTFSANVICIRQDSSKGAFCVLRLKISAVKYVSQHSVHQCIGCICDPRTWRQPQIPFAQPCHDFRKL